MEKIITNSASAKIYTHIRNLPVLDYHCHLNPKEIYEDKTFSGLGEMWLSGDHYKWRLMRFAGVEEKYITGNETSYKEKFVKFIEVLSTAFGNPIKDWAELELRDVFGIECEICPKNADFIWDTAEKYIKTAKLSPRKLLEKFNVEYVATTDEVCDTLEYHRLLASENMKTKIVPSFRVDKFVVFDGGYCEYLKKFGEISGIEIVDLHSFKSAIQKRLDFFVENGCKFTDIGIEGFPNEIADEAEAERTFLELLENKTSEDVSDALQGYILVFLGKEYAKRNLIMQLHLCAKRNSNSKMLETIGRDSGFDCVGKPLDSDGVTKVLDAMFRDGLLPKTIIYTLNPSMYYELISMCGAFPGCTIGIPWWFCDHREGFFDFFKTAVALGHIGSLFGMLTDSRSFLSYVRHDYFRQILSEYLSRFWVGSANSENDKNILKTAEKLSYFNALNAIGS